MPRFWTTAGALNMLVAVIISAGLGHRSGLPYVTSAQSIIDTAREMHFIHALAMMSVGICGQVFGQARLLDVAGAAFLAGSILFSGSIYLAHGLDIAAVRPLIPAGGLACMLGWVCLAAGIWQGRARG